MKVLWDAVSWEHHHSPLSAGTRPRRVPRQRHAHSSSTCGARSKSQVSHSFVDPGPQASAEARPRTAQRWSPVSAADPARRAATPRQGPIGWGKKSGGASKKKSKFSSPHLHPPHTQTSYLRVTNIRICFTAHLPSRPLHPFSQRCYAAPCRRRRSTGRWQPVCLRIFARR